MLTLTSDWRQSHPPIEFCTTQTYWSSYMSGFLRCQMDHGSNIQPLKCCWPMFWMCLIACKPQSRWQGLPYVAPEKTFTWQPAFSLWQVLLLSSWVLETWLSWVWLFLRCAWANILVYNDSTKQHFNDRFGQQHYLSCECGKDSKEIQDTLMCHDFDIYFQKAVFHNDNGENGSGTSTSLWMSIAFFDCWWKFTQWQWRKWQQCFYIIMNERHFFCCWQKFSHVSEWICLLYTNSSTKYSC
jgi:hypothetical protein